MTVGQGARSCVRLGFALLLFGSLAAADANAQYTRVSLGHNGTNPTHGGLTPSISADGRFVSFIGGGLTPGESGSGQSLYVRDRQLNTTTRVSVTSAGEERPGYFDTKTQEISANGRFVVWDTTAQLVADDTNTCAGNTGPSCPDVYIHDRETAATTRISVSTSGAQANHRSYFGHVSGDGRFVVFISDASNLVPNDTNNAPDVFLRDRQAGTTTRVSVSVSGAQIATGAERAILSADGSVVVFNASYTAAELATPPACSFGQRGGAIACMPAYIYRTDTGQVSLLSKPWAPFDSAWRNSREEPMFVSHDGRIVVAHQTIDNVHTPLLDPWKRQLYFDRTADRMTMGALEMNETLLVPGALSGDGHLVLTLEPNDTAQMFVLHDRTRGFTEAIVKPASAPDAVIVISASISATGRYIAFQTHAQLVPEDPGLNADIYVYDRDTDGDGMPSTWETRFGLDPASAADAAADNDGDGMSNLQEFEQGTHPNGAHKRYLAEGAANAFFTTRLAAVNPTDVSTQVAFKFLGQNGLTSSLLRTLPARSRMTVELGPNDPAPTNDFSTVIESEQPIIVDRTMTWDATGFGTHAETSIAGASTSWYLAEGATHGAFDLFYLLQNANAVDTMVTVSYLRLAPLTPITKQYLVPANSRLTIWVDQEDAALAEVDLAARITSVLPIIVERAMYFSTPSQTFAAGGNSAAVPAPALNWFLAEGATGSFFDLFVLVANPNTTASNLKVTYLLPDGAPIVKNYTVGAENRLTISVQGEDPRLLDTPVSVTVESTNNQPVVVERAMWWPKGSWHEGHLSAGATTTGTRWALADGEVGTPPPVATPHVIPQHETETYILIANTGATESTATITLFVEGGEPRTHVVGLPAQSRVNVPVSSILAPDQFWRFGALIESNGAPIVVERAMYTSANGVTWTAGTAALATKLQ